MLARVGAAVTAAVLGGPVLGGVGSGEEFVGSAEERGHVGGGRILDRWWCFGAGGEDALDRCGRTGHRPARPGRTRLPAGRDRHRPGRRGR